LLCIRASLGSPSPQSVSAAASCITSFLDLFWLRDESLGDAADLRSPSVIAAEIVEDLEEALVEFSEVAASLAALNERFMQSANARCRPDEERTFARITALGSPPVKVARADVCKC
jgi:hypothetical protein